MNEMKPQRLVFGETLVELAEEYPYMVVLDCDVSSSTQTKHFGQKYPDRFYNFGIAEANMVSAAAGMAAAGLIPVCSTFAFLLAFRAGDAIRSQIGYSSLNVKLCGGYAGLSDFADGASHQAITDVAVMRAIPNLTVVVPSDTETTRGAVKAMLDHEGPVYLRLSREAVGSLHDGDGSFTMGKGRLLKDGSDLTLVSAGPILAEVLKAADILEAAGVKAAVLETPTIKPLDADAVRQQAEKTGMLFTIEEHSTVGGLGGAVAEAVSEACPVPVVRLGLNDEFGQSGKYADLLETYGLTAGKIAETVRSKLTAIN